MLTELEKQQLYNILTIFLSSFATLLFQTLNYVGTQISRSSASSKQHQRTPASTFASLSVKDNVMSLVGSLVIGQLLAEELRRLSCGGVNSKVREEVNDQVSERTVREGRE